jgi:hypothetical protein
MASKRRQIVPLPEETSNNLFTSTSSWFPLNTGLGLDRTKTIKVDSRNPETLFAGAEQGGVWKSVNGGESCLIYFCTLQESVTNVICLIFSKIE